MIGKKLHPLILAIFVSFSPTIFAQELSDFEAFKQQRNAEINQDSADFEAFKQQRNTGVNQDSDNFEAYKQGQNTATGQDRTDFETFKQKKQNTPPRESAFGTPNPGGTVVFEEDGVRYSTNVLEDIQRVEKDLADGKPLKTIVKEEGAQQNREAKEMRRQIQDDMDTPVADRSRSMLDELNSATRVVNNPYEIKDDSDPSETPSAKTPTQSSIPKVPEIGTPNPGGTKIYKADGIEYSTNDLNQIERIQKSVADGTPLELVLSEEKARDRQQSDAMRGTLERNMSIPVEDRSVSMLDELDAATRGGESQDKTISNPKPAPLNNVNTPQEEANTPNLYSGNGSREVASDVAKGIAEERAAQGLPSQTSDVFEKRSTGAFGDRGNPTDSTTPEELSNSNVRTPSIDLNKTYNTDGVEYTTNDLETIQRIENAVTDGIPLDLVLSDQKVQDRQKEFDKEQVEVIKKPSLIDMAIDDNNSKSDLPEAIKRPLPETIRRDADSGKNLLNNAVTNINDGTSLSGPGYDTEPTEYTRRNFGSGVYQFSDGNTRTITYDPEMKAFVEQGLAEGRPLTELHRENFINRTEKFKDKLQTDSPQDAAGQESSLLDELSDDINSQDLPASIRRDSDSKANLLGNAITDIDEGNALSGSGYDNKPTSYTTRESYGNIRFEDGEGSSFISSKQDEIAYIKQGLADGKSITELRSAIENGAAVDYVAAKVPANVGGLGFARDTDNGITTFVMDNSSFATDRPSEVRYMEESLAQGKSLMEIATEIRDGAAYYKYGQGSVDNSVSGGENPLSNAINGGSGIQGGGFNPVSGGASPLSNAINNGSGIPDGEYSPVAPNSTGGGNNSNGTGGFSGDIAQVEKAINGIMDFPINTKGPNIEYAHLWFKQIFGGFIFAPWNDKGGEQYKPDDQTVLSKALGFTNILAIILCLVIGYYLIVGGAINTASKGEVLGKSWDGPWLALRTSIGFGLLVPLKGIGGLTLSFSQIAVIWLIMIGSNAATLLWNLIGESIIDGTQIVKPRLEVGASDLATLGNMAFCSQLKVLSNAIDHNKTKHRIVSDNKHGDGKPTQATERPEAIQLANPQNPKIEVFRVKYANGTGLGEGGGTYASVVHPNRKSFTNAVYAHSGEMTVDSSNQVKEITFGPDGSCGRISFPYLNSRQIVKVQGDKGSDVVVENITTTETDTDYDSVRATSYKTHAVIAGGQAYAGIIAQYYNEMNNLNEIFHTAELSGAQVTSGVDKKEKSIYIDGIASTAIYRELAEESTKNDVIRTYYQTKFADAFDTIAYRYNDDVNSKIYSATVGSQAFKDKIRKEMLHGGWASAGVWFVELSSIPSLPYQVVKQVTDSMEYSVSPICSTFLDYTNTCSSITSAMESYSGILEHTLRQASIDGKGYITEKDKNSSLCSAGGKCENVSNVTDRVSVSVAKGILGALGTSDESSSLNPLNGGLASPFLFLAEIGQTLNNYAYVAIGGIIAIKTTVEVMEGYGKKISGTWLGVLSDLSGASLLTWGIKATALSLLKNSAMVAISGLLVVVMSAIMSGFVLAYVIPFMPVTTWILMMAGYMLTVVEAVAAAPLAIVLLFTPEGSGIAGSRFERALNLVAMAILRPSFMIIGLISAITVSFVAFSMMNTFFFKAAEHLLAGHLFDAIAIMLIYTSTAYQLCKMMVENMHQLPDRIGEWFAGGVSRQFGESRVNDSAEQSVQGAAGAFKSMPGQMMSMQSSMKDTNQKLDGISDAMKKESK